MKHEIELDEKLFEIMYELEDIISIENTHEMNNMVDISVEGNQTFILGNGILSHNSASNSISKILGRKGNGFFAMFGVPPNAYDMNIKEIIESKKMVELQEIIGLRFSKTEQTEINFDNIIITTDFDLPGHFIAGQLLGLFYRFGKNLFEEGRIKRFITPLILVTKNDKTITWFYDFESYQDFERKNRDKKYKYDYKKGLGSWDVEELEEVIVKDGLENMLETFTLDDVSEESIDSWLNGKRANKRKEMLEGFEFNIMNS
jgi:topoisomerase-4 subunit B